MVLATSVVKYNEGSDGDDYIFKIDKDDILNINPDGSVKSSFSPNDYIYYTVNKSKNVKIDEIAVTDGSMIKLGTVNRTGNDQSLFKARTDKDAESESFSIPYADPIVSHSFVGKKGKIYEKLSAIGVKSYTPEILLTPFLCDFDYSFDASSYRFTAPDVSLDENETYEIAIVFYITVG